MQPIRRVSTIVLNAFRFHWEHLSREGDYCPASPAFLAAYSALAHADNLLKSLAFKRRRAQRGGLILNKGLRVGNFFRLTKRGSGLGALSLRFFGFDVLGLPYGGFWGGPERGDEQFRCYLENQNFWPNRPKSFGFDVFALNLWNPKLPLVVLCLPALGFRNFPEVNATELGTTPPEKNWYGLHNSLPTSRNCVAASRFYAAACHGFFPAWISSTLGFPVFGPPHAIARPPLGDKGSAHWFV